VKSVGSRLDDSRFRLANWLRVICLFWLAVVLSLALALHGARANFDGAMMSFGSRAMAFPGAPVDEARTLRLNGIEVLFRSQVVAAPLELVLRYYRSTCSTPRAESGDYGPLIASLATRSRSTDREGYVACVETDVSDLETLTEHLVKFSRTWDLAHLGSLRYAYATRAADHPEQKTFLITMWADESLDLRSFLPIAGSDAGGADPKDLPRPPHSQRILSAIELTAPSSVYAYIAPAAPPATVPVFYREALLTGGWDILERSPDETFEVDGVRILSAEKAGRILSVLAHPRVPSGSVVTLLVSGVD
jgi:hypothetical protein